MSTETPAELIAGDVALAIRQGHIEPGEPLPSPERLAASYDELRATAEGALIRLSRAGVIGGDASQGTFVAPELTGVASQALDVMAAPAMCRWLAAAPAGGRGLYDDPEALQAARERFLAADRRALRGELTERDAGLVAAARKILRAGGQPPSGQLGAPGTRLDLLLAGAGWAAAAAWPVAVTGGLAAAATSPGRRQPRPRDRPRHAAWQAPVTRRNT